MSVSPREWLKHDKSKHRQPVYDIVKQWHPEERATRKLLIGRIRCSTAAHALPPVRCSPIPLETLSLPDRRLSYELTCGCQRGARRLHVRCERCFACDVHIFHLTQPVPKAPQPSTSTAFNATKMEVSLKDI